MKSGRVMPGFLGPWWTPGSELASDALARWWSNGLPGSLGTSGSARLPPGRLCGCRGSIVRLLAGWYSAQLPKGCSDLRGRWYRWVLCIGGKD